jgi:hypothetical protein
MRRGISSAKIVGQDRHVEKKSFWPIHLLFCPHPGGSLARELLQKSMARKINPLRASQEARGQAAVSNRRPMPLTAALYLAQLRPSVLKVPPRARRRIAVQIEEQLQAPRAVKIIPTG